jgi:hypothetical protein
MVWRLPSASRLTPRVRKRLDVVRLLEVVDRQDWRIQHELMELAEELVSLIEA